MAKYTKEQLVQLLRKAGIPEKDIPMMVAIALAESAGNSDAQGDQKLADNKCSQFLYFLPIEDIARDLSMGIFNKYTTRKNILYINSDLKPYEKQLLKELFFDHNLHFDYNLHIAFDEILVSLNPNTYSNLYEITQTLLKTNLDTPIKFRLDSRINPNFNEVHQLIESLYGSHGWLSGGHETYFISAV